MHCEEFIICLSGHDVRAPAKKSCIASREFCIYDKIFKFCWYLLPGEVNNKCILQS